MCIAFSHIFQLPLKSQTVDTVVMEDTGVACIINSCALRINTPVTMNRVLDNLVALRRRIFVNVLESTRLPASKLAEAR